MSLQDTPRSNRLHIGIFGRRNSGKSSLINALTGQPVAVVSEVAGTTTDPVYKSMEIHGIGPCVFIDTAGFDDEGALGALRVIQTEKALEKTDVALLLFYDAVTEQELSWARRLKAARIPVVAVVNKADLSDGCGPLCADIREKLGLEAIPASALTGSGVNSIREALIRAIPEDFESESITRSLVGPGDLVLLVMPQDIQAPKGRLILPQVQVLRELLDKKCLIMSATTDLLEQSLASLSAPPKLIITDSQVFRTVWEKKPAESRLTSFSVLMAGYKGDLPYFVESAAAIDALTENSRVLIAEACTHAPLAEDIGREKIPNMLRKKVGAGLRVDTVAGTDFPEDLSPYDLIIHCGGCMFNRKYLLSRVEAAKAAGVPMSNYGVVIACLAGILPDVDLPY
ncbi:MAG: [FeFe] hydrogenase H-cluster maturation GTPase HydF [Oscillospiraceae bacterium]|nr:[FeFe] hydrogenase H-cluster maturation GTPase HydF [Oscillospiraceae bacterium]